MARFGKLLQGAALALIGAELLFSLFVARMAPCAGDDGFFQYLAALHFHHGLVPIRDFLCEYSPGFVYFFSGVWTVMGVGVTDTLLAMALVGFAIVILSSMACAYQTGSLNAALFCAVVMIPMRLVYEGGYAYTEPLVMIFVMAAYLLQIKGGRRWSWATGLFLGSALMMKQSAMVFLPAFGLDLVMRGGVWGRWKALVIWLAGLGVPFGFFCLANGLPFLETLWYVADYGHQEYRGDFISLPETIRFHLQMWVFVWPALGSAVWVLWRHRSNYALALGCLAGALALCSCQSSYHYFLSALPFLCLTLAQAATDLWRFAGPVKIGVAGLVGMMAVGVLGRDRLTQKLSALTGPEPLFRTFYGGLDGSVRRRQIKKASIIRDMAGDRKLMILGDVAMQYYSGIRLYVDEPNMGYLRWPQDQDLIDGRFLGRCDFIVVRPSQDRYNYEGLIQHLKESGYVEHARIAVWDDVVVDLRRP
ncbi:MAG: hypothetical protein AB7F75_01515 [Planctomycetota bacterium]